MVSAFEVAGCRVQPMKELEGCGWFFLDHTLYMEDRGSPAANQRAARDALRELDSWRARAVPLKRARGAR